MGKLQEMQSWLHMAIEYMEKFYDLALISSPNLSSSDVKEQHDYIIDHTKQVIDYLVADSATNLRHLSYILINDFDGEYLMSGADLVMEFNSDYTYFLGYEYHPEEGSLRIFAYRERQE